MVGSIQFFDEKNEMLQSYERAMSGKGSMKDDIWLLITEAKFHVEPHDESWPCFGSCNAIMKIAYKHGMKDWIAVNYHEAHETLKNSEKEYAGLPGWKKAIVWLSNKIMDLGCWVNLLAYK